MPSCPKTFRKRDRSKCSRACVTYKVDKGDRFGFGFGYFTPDLEKIKQLLVCSKHQNT